ncbi:MAG: beta-lactamase family protein [bacterium]|nr:beta-lactamase family protein [bacterium]
MQSFRYRVFVLLWIVGTTSAASLSMAQPYPSQTEPSQPDRIPNEALELLRQHMQELVEQREVVGCELHILQAGETLLHEAFGWADLQEQRPLEVNSVFCVRSMTKPLVGTAIQLLIEDGELALEQPVAEILPEFDVPDKRSITVEQLLTHSSGLPFSTFQRPLSEYATIRDVAVEAAGAKLVFPPGTGFQYSDAGSDTLGAVVAAVAGESPEVFIERRILEPLQLVDTFTLLGDQETLRMRIPSAYSGGAGNWQRHWHNRDAPIFPLFLTSQSLYSTTTDYARFLQLWIARGVYQGKQLLTAAAVARGLQPGRRIDGYRTGFEGLELSYGQQWMIYSDGDQPVIFGHNGSDGTHAWAWPDRDLIVLFFTQSRGTTAGVELEATLDRLLIQHDVEGYRADAQARRETRASLGRYEGLYWDQDAETAYYLLYLQDEQLVFERPGRIRSVAKPQAKANQFLVAGSVQLAFEEGDPAPAVVITSGQRTERQVRHVNDPTLPSANEIRSQVAKSHGIHKLDEAGIVKLSGTVKMGPLGFTSKIHQWFDSQRLRTEIHGWASNTVIVIRGDQVGVSQNGAVFELQTGAVRAQEILGHPSIHYGEWSKVFQNVEVLKRYSENQKERLLLRAEPAGLPGSSMVVDAESGLIVAEQSLQFVPGAGFIGAEFSYADFRDVAGMQLPFRVESKFMNPLIGSVVIQFDEVEVGVEDTRLFELSP